MRILQIVDSTNPQGTERHLSELSALLSGRGHEVRAVCPPGGWLGGELAQKGIDVRLGQVKRKSLASPFFVRREILGFNPDIIHAHSERATWFALTMAWPRRFRVVSTMHMPRPHPVYHKLVRAGGRIIAVAEFGKRMLVEDGVPGDAISVVYNSTFAAAQPPPGRDETLWHELDIPRERELVGVVARMNEDKGQRIALRALSLLPKRVLDKVQLLLAGPVEPEFEKRLVDDTASLGLQDNVRILGPRRDVRRIMGSLSMKLLPSLKEAFPIAMLEAMAAAKPVAAYPSGGVSEAITHGETGLLIERTPESAAWAIESLIEDGAERRRMGERARARAVELYSPDAMVARVERLYQRALNSTGGR